ncbi:haloacid dehalogenase type II [Halospeciosus flavus]|uniref:Haloacid dehalogenase type II n=1 Tax=Halospeciosus flavus TaxID=3032283 RepID=A0ABD5Z876_9EURY|nr:haloacid dehalogenase type II [Halospeciosus flavus]
MPLDTDLVSTVTFDSYSTLVDVDAAVRALAGRVDDPDAVSSLWRARSLTYATMANFLDFYRPFFELNRGALRYALDYHDEDLSAAERDEVLAVYHELDVFDDVREGVERLVDAGYDCYVVSNGDPEMLATLVEHTDVADLVADTVSADEIRTYKPAADLYRHAAGRTGTPIDEVVHVSAGWFDVAGACHAGMQGVWVDRKDTPPEPFGGDPDLTVRTLHDLADTLGA